MVGLRNARCRVCNFQASVALNDREFRVTEWISVLDGEHWRGPSNNDVPSVPAEGIGVVGHHAHSEHSTQARSRLMGLGKVSGRCGGLYARGSRLGERVMRKAPGIRICASLEPWIHATPRVYRVHRTGSSGSL